MLTWPVFFKKRFENYYFILKSSKKYKEEQYFKRKNLEQSNTPIVAASMYIDKNIAKL